ncbi:efflux RND transporter periplasmic adaptor subunit [Legionella sp. CNM-4043-24]|uniref:efflux RND transporter periplasmic adaptor subunit n=1 Tax=Legionella sp. CNM-4043-24 TaxID=3421646 RepID=UPI00403A8366
MNFQNQSKPVKIIIVVLALALLAYVVKHVFFKSSGPVIPVPVVVVQSPQWREMAEYVTQTGNTVAFNSVNLVARVEGYLDSFSFKDGSFVKKGQELFVIQPLPYLEQLKAANATVAAQKAGSAYAQSEYARQKRMYKENATSLNSVEIWLAKTHEAEAEVDKAVADAVQSEINYGYTHVKAPFDGRIGRHLVDPGNLVGHGEATQLATIDQISPMYVYFNLNELDLIRLRKAARAHGFKPDDLSKVPVYVSMQNENGFKYKATLDFVNTGLNASTGTMELRAVLENKDYDFVPGLFVQVKIAITMPAKQLTVPDTAIMYDQIGPYLLLVDQQNIVQLQRIELGGLEQGIRAVTKGLTINDRVIVAGLQNATPGNKVDAREQQDGKAAA